MQFIWYLTLTSAIWSSSLFSINTLFGVTYPFHILVLTLIFILILQKNIRIDIFSKQSLLFFLFLIFYASLTLFWVNDIERSITKLSHYIFGLFFLISSILINKNIESVKKTIKAFTLNYILILTIAVYEIFNGEYFHATNVIQTYHKNDLGFHYPLVIFNNTNDLAVFLFMFLPIALYGVNLLSRSRKIYVIITFLIAYFIIINVGSRMINYLIVFYSIILAIYILFEKLTNQTKIILIAISPVVIFFMINFGYLEIINNFYLDIKHDVRLLLFYQTIEAVIDTHLLGVGIGNVLNVLNYNVHNYGLEVLVELGIFVFIGFSVWLFILFRRLLEVFHHNKLKKPERLLLFILIINIIFIPFWTGVSSTMGSKLHIWIYFSFSIIISSQMNKKVEPSKLIKIKDLERNARHEHSRIFRISN